jgi:hypothetical protein
VILGRKGHSFLWWNWEEEETEEDALRRRRQIFSMRIGVSLRIERGGENPNGKYIGRRDWSDDGMEH